MLSAKMGQQYMHIDMYDTHVSNLEISRAVIGGNYGRGRGRDNSGHLVIIPLLRPPFLRPTSRKKRSEGITMKTCAFASQLSPPPSHEFTY